MNSNRLSENTTGNKIPYIFRTMEYGPLIDGRSLASDWILDNFTNVSFITLNGLKLAVSCTQCEDGPKVVLKHLFDKYDKQQTVNYILKHAREAAKSWRQLNGHIRARHLYSIARNLQKYSALLVQIESVERNIQTRHSREWSVANAIRVFYHFAGYAQLSYLFDDWEPLGIVGSTQIETACPFATLAWGTASALAAGNSVIIFAPCVMPLTAVLFKEICDKARIPENLVSFVFCSDDAREFYESLDKVMVFQNHKPHLPFTHINYSAMTANSKCTALVFDDADLDSSVDSILENAWFCQGQVPWSINHLLIQETIFSKLMEKLKCQMSKMRMGKPFDKMADVGLPMSSRMIEYLKKCVAEAKRKGIEVFQSCEESSEFVRPTLFIGGSPFNDVLEEEEDDRLPGVAVLPFRTESEAVALANNSRCGLAASVWSENGALTQRIAAQLQVGTVWVNSSGLFDAAVPFSCWNESGYGTINGQQAFFESLKPKWCKKKSDTPNAVKSEPNDVHPSQLMPSIEHHNHGDEIKPPDMTSRNVERLSRLVPQGNRKDVRDAVEAALKSQKKWWQMGCHGRAQIIYSIAEKLLTRSEHFKSTPNDVEETLEILFFWAANCDKSTFNSTQIVGDMNVFCTQEPHGLVGILLNKGVLQRNPLSTFVAIVVPAIAYGNTTVIVGLTSEDVIMQFCELLHACDLPKGVVNVLFGDMYDTELTAALSGHCEVSVLWLFTPEENPDLIEFKRIRHNKVWLCNWDVPTQACRLLNRTFIELKATQSKAIWVSNK